MKLFIKNNIKFIIVIVICLIGSSITTLATNYIFNSNEVSYDNTESGLHADEVQGAIDEVFQYATDYSDIKTKIGTGTLNTTSNTLIGGVNELNGKLTSFPKYVIRGLTNGSPVTYTFESNIPFMVQIFRSNSSSTGYNGLYIGQAHNNGSIKAVLASDAISAISIEGKTLSITASANYVNCTIILFPV